MSRPTSHLLDPTPLEPLPTLLSRLRAEASASFVPGKPIRVSRAAGRLDVMGGIAGYTGSLVCEYPIDRAASVALQERDDRVVQVLSLNLLDAHLPFALMVPLETLANHPLETLRKEFSQPGRAWAGMLAGCLAVLHDEKLVNLADPSLRGVNLAVYSTIPPGAGLASSPAVVAATMMNLAHHLGLDQSADPIAPIRLASLSQRVLSDVVGKPTLIADLAACVAGQGGKLMRMLCQPHELLEPLEFPEGIHCVGIQTGVKSPVAASMYPRTRAAAFMGHKIILDKMKQMGTAAGKVMAADPLNGYLANLSPADYKKLFRQFLPELLKGGAFLLGHGATLDKGSSIEPDYLYPVQSAVDHHVLDAMRIRNFIAFLEEARTTPDPAHRKLTLNKAGHLMYASHLSYTNDARLGTEECDLLVDLVRQHEPRGLYGAKLTAGGGGGTIAVLCDDSDQAHAAIAEIIDLYKQKTGKSAGALLRSSAGAWEVGTALCESAE